MWIQAADKSRVVVQSVLGRLSLVVLKRRVFHVVFLDFTFSVFDLTDELLGGSSHA